MKHALRSTAILLAMSLAPALALAQSTPPQTGTPQGGGAPGMAAPQGGAPSMGNSAGDTGTMGGKSPGQTTSHLRHQASASGQDAKHAQSALKSQGLYHGPIDGIVGPQTKSALMEYQQREGLQQTGKLDRQTMASLNTGGNQGSGSSGAPAPGGANTGGSQGNGQDSHKKM